MSTDITPFDPPATAAPATAAPVTAASDDPRRNLRRFVYGLVIAIVIGQGLGHLVTVSTWFSAARWPEQRPPSSPMFSANDRSRWCTVWSLVERGTYQIDEISEVPGWDTIDKVRQEGHFYSSKPPLLPTLVAGLYWLLKQTFGLDLLKQTHETVYVILFLINVLPTAVSLWSLSRMLERYALHDTTRLFVMLTAAFGTLLTPFLTTFNNHTIAAYSLIFALEPTLRIVGDGDRRCRSYLLAGFWTAWAVCNELPACLFGVLQCLLFARQQLRRTALCYLPAALVPLLGFFATNYIVAGTWKPFYAGFNSPLYLYEVDGVPSYWTHPSGIDESTEPWYVYLFHCTFGHHGLFSLSPVFLLTVWGWFRWKAWGPQLSQLWRPIEHPLSEASAETRQRVTSFVCLMSHSLTVWVLVFYLRQTSSYNYGGNTAGLRWAFWLIPFWLLGMIPLLEALGHRRPFRLLACLLLACSTFSATYPHINPWQPTWLQSLMERWGWIDYRTAVPAFTQPRYTWFNPLGHSRAQPDTPDWIEFTGTGPVGNGVSLKLREVRRDSRPDGQLRQITWQAEWSGGTLVKTEEKTLSFTLDLDKYRTGARPENALIGATANETFPATGIQARFLYGLPGPSQYTPGSIRYVKTSLRKNAFKCQLASASVMYRPARDAAPLRYRRTIWMCEEVPGGVLQFEDTVFDPADNAMLYRQRFTATALSGYVVPAPP